MKVSASNQNYKPVMPSQQASKSNTSFKGKVDIARELSQQIGEGNKGAVRILTKLGKVNKESLGTVITAIGTAFVAPIFIAFNPISKEDKDTKIYSAMRQPISAVIALGIQLGVNKKFNNYLDTLASTGQLDRADLRAEPLDSYLKRLIKIQQPNLSKPELEKAIKDSKSKAFWETVAKARKDMKNTKIDYKDLVDTEIFSKAKAELAKEKEELLKGKTKKEQAKILDKATIMERAVKNVEKEMEFEGKVKFVTSRLKKSGISLETARNNLQAESDSLFEKIQLNLANPERVKRLQTKQEVIDGALKKLNRVESFDQLKIHGDSFKEVLQSVKIKQFIEAKTSVAKSVLKENKSWGAIILALTTLPFSCGLLNWAYPRLMEKFMPEIANAKKAKGGK